MCTGIDSNDNEELLWSYANWALEAGVWDGKPVSWFNISETQNEFVHRIHLLLFSNDPESRAFKEMALQFAWVGSSRLGRQLIDKEIEELQASPDKDAILAKRGFFSRLWKHHKTEIIIGIVALGLISAVAITAVCIGSGAAGALASAGASAVDSATGQEKRFHDPDSSKINQLLPENSMPIEQLPSLPSISSLPSLAPDEFSIVESGVIIDGKFYSYLQFCEHVRERELINRLLDGEISESPAFNQVSPAQPLIETAPAEKYLPACPVPQQIQIQHPSPGPLFADVITQKVPSQRFTIVGQDPKPQLCITGINGMATKFEQAVNHASYVSQLSGTQSVNWVYNNTNGPITDLAEVFGSTYNGLPRHEENLLLAEWTNFHKQNIDNPHAKIFHICHSKGAPHTRNTLIQASPEIQSRVIVVAIAPACPISRKLCFNSYNYAVKGDFVPFGELTYRSAFDLSETGSSLITQKAVDDFMEIVWLDSLPDSENSAHDFQNPAFAKKISDHLLEYQMKNGEYQ